MRLRGRVGDRICPLWAANRVPACCRIVRVRRHARVCALAAERNDPPQASYAARIRAGRAPLPPAKVEYRISLCTDCGWDASEGRSFSRVASMAEATLFRYSRASLIRRFSRNQTVGCVSEYFLHHGAILALGQFPDTSLGAFQMPFAYTHERDALSSVMAFPNVCSSLVT